MAKIYIDAGHGGKDGGAVGRGLLEKNVTLELAKLTKKYLEENYTNVDVRLTRDDDEYLTLSQRANLANAWGADAFLSIHINSAGGTAGDGFESYIYNGPIQSETPRLQDEVHKAILKEAPFFKDRGQKKANFAVVRETNMPAVLTENGFINNPSNLKILQNQNNLEAIAKGHAVGLAKFLELKRNPSPAPKEEANLYKVQVGAFSEKENAERLAEKLEQDGYNTYIVTE